MKSSTPNTMPCVYLTCLEGLSGWAVADAAVAVKVSMRLLLQAKVYIVRCCKGRWPVLRQVLQKTTLRRFPPGNVRAEGAAGSGQGKFATDSFGPRLAAWAARGRGCPDPPTGADPAP